MEQGALASPVTTRFNRKRDAIIAAATDILNHQGVRGMTLGLVAERVGLITTSVTYYFRKKDELAAACFLAGLERLTALIEAARVERTASARVRRLLALYIGLRARIAAGEEPPIPIFSDIRALSPETQGPIADAYVEMFRAVRRLFGGAGGQKLARGPATARAQILLDQIHWLEAWLPRYDPQDYDRVCERMHDILVGGLAAPGAVWAPAPIAIAPEAPGGARDAFLRAATRLINQRGYHGASVELISASLNVTKGSFYHHHHCKDDVVIACFERSFELVRQAQLAARALEGSEWRRLTSAAAALVEFQFSPAGPLLRSSALAALPAAIRGEMIVRSYRLSDRFAAMISDGVAEGSLRAVDPFIAAQMLNATLNAAADLPVLLRGAEPQEAVDSYARAFFTGLTSA